MPASIGNRPSSSSPRRALAVGGLCLCGLTAQVAGCGRGATEPLRGACTSELRVVSSPGDTTVSVGASFTASVKLSSCGGAVQLSDTFAWRSSDLSIVSVGATSGVVTARASGQANLYATGLTYGPVGFIRVTVR